MNYDWSKLQDLLTKAKDFKEVNLEEFKKFEISKSEKWRYDFDPDSSPEAWDYYFERYHWLSRDYKEQLKLTSIDSENEKKYRLYLVIAGDKNKNINIKVSGDCSFNFNPKKVSILRNLIEDLSKKSNEISECDIKRLNYKLDVCEKMHHNLLNFDLMPQTGALNNLKGRLKYNESDEIIYHGAGKIPQNLLDRLDTFINFLDDSLNRLEKLELSEKKDVEDIGVYLSNSVFTPSLMSENFECLYSYFVDEIKTVECYWKKFYIDNVELLERLKENGSKPITTVNCPIVKKQQIEDYLNLAISFWLAKLEAFEKIDKVNQDKQNQTKE